MKLPDRKNLVAFARHAAVPLVIFALFVAFMVVYHLLDLPSADEELVLAKQYYAEYGYWVVFLAALAEGTLFINWYLPGSVVAAFGVAFAAQIGLNVVFVVALIILGFFITSVINYALGRFGWYHLFLKLGLSGPLEKIKARTERKGLAIIFSTYFHPNVGALTATSAGILKFSFPKFCAYSLAALVVWDTAWSILTVFVGPPILNILSIWTILLMLAVWIVVRAVSFVRGKNAVVPPNVP